MNTKPTIAMAAFALVPSLAAPVWASEAGSRPTAETPPATVEEGAVLHRARERFDRGLRLHREGELQLALIEFNRAYELVPNYRVLYNIGQLSFELDRYADARRALERYLNEGADELPPARIEGVKKDLESLRARTAHLMVLSNIRGAEVFVDDVSVGTTPLSVPLLVDAGVHRVRVNKRGYAQRTSRLTLAGVEERTLLLELSPVTPTERTIVVRESAATDRSTDMLVVAGWVSTGALAVGAIVTGVMGAGEARELEQLRGSQGDLSLRSDLDQARSNAKTLLLASDILSGAALVAGGASLWLSMRDREHSTTPSKPDLQVGFHRGQLRVKTRF